MWHIGFIGAAVTLFLSVASRIFDTVSDYLGSSNPNDRQRRLDDHKHAVERVIGMRHDFLQNDERPSSQQARNWLQRVKDLEAEKAKIHTRFDNAWINIFVMWRCAREASKEQKRAEDLATQYKDLCQEQKRRPRPVECVRLEGSVKMEPYETILFEFINSQESCLLGIWGMGGVGKSTLLQLISTSRSRYAAPDESFEILCIHAGRNCTVAKLQRTICENLGLAVVSPPEERYQAQAIHYFLKDKSFLVLLDDMWEVLDLRDIGIPVLPRTQGPRQKIVLTSRMMNVCALMNCGRNIIHMLCPSEEVAMKIFSDAVGPHVMKDIRFPPLAKMIVKECGHLPEALQKIGLAMSIKNEVDDWEHTIDLLRKSKLHLITHKSEDLLDRLKWSYDQLEDNFKSCFLICSLWQEGESIALDKLIRWWTGMGLLDGPDAYRDGSCKARALQNTSLLEKGANSLSAAEGSQVRMHDMVRKMAMRVVNDKKEVWASNSSCRPDLTEEMWYKVHKAWVSSRDTDALVSKVDFGSKYLYSKQLTMLITRHAFILQPAGLFESIVFLDMEGSDYRTFPTEICSMKNLEYLNLSSTRIGALPLKLTYLSKLKYLYIRDNSALRRIPKGVIAKLGSLEEFDLFCTSSMSLSSFLVDLGNPAVVLSMIGFTVQTEAELQELTRLRQVRAVSICLHQFKNQIINLDLLSEMRKCRELYIADSPSVRQLVAQEGAEVILPCLQSFEIRNLSSLGRVVLNSTWLSTTTVNVSNCEMLTDLTFIRQLVNLEQLTVSDCKNMEIVVSVSAIPSRNQNEVSLPKLKKIHLQELPSLSTLCDVRLQLDSISHFCIVGCDRLTRLPVQQQNNTKVRLYCNASWWKDVVAVEENIDMMERFSPDHGPVSWS